MMGPTAAVGLGVLLVWTAGPTVGLTVAWNASSDDVGIVDIGKSVEEQKVASSARRPDLDFSKAPPNDEQRLLRFILRAYDRSVRPVWNASKTVTVQVGLTLTQIFNINEKKQILSMNVWLEQVSEHPPVVPVDTGESCLITQRRPNGFIRCVQAWVDERVRWNPEDFSNLALLTVPTRFLWTPDIVLLNNAEDFSHGIAQTNVNLYPDGSVLWAPPIQSHSVCKLNVALFPFDQQICKLRYASWIYDANQVDVTNRSHKINMDPGNFLENGEWHVVSTSARRNVRKHPYYPDVAYADVTFTLSLRRRVLYYMYNIICPCAMLSVLTLLQFWLPCESGEKVTLGLTVLLAYSVFSFNIGEKLPETSDVVPLIAIYITCIMGISSVSVGFSVVVLNIKHGGEDNYPTPRWLRFVAARIVAPLVCWRNDHENRMLRRWLTVEKNFYRTFRTLSAQIATAPMIRRHRQRRRRSSSPQLTVETETSLVSAPVAPPSDGQRSHRESAASCLEDSTGRPSIADDQQQQEAEPIEITRSHRSCYHPYIPNANMVGIFGRTGRILAKLERDLKHEQLMHEWRKIAQIFDRLFFWLIASVTVAWAVVMLLIAPTFSYRPLASHD